jgi:hypothetical protein
MAAAFIAQNRASLYNARSIEATILMTFMPMEK